MSSTLKLFCDVFVLLLYYLKTLNVDEYIQIFFYKTENCRGSTGVRELHYNVFLILFKEIF